jgi:hypothetical protein
LSGVHAALAEGQILDGIHAVAVLDVVVGMIQQVEGLHCSDRFWRSVKRKLRLTPGRSAASKVRKKNSGPANALGPALLMPSAELLVLCRATLLFRIVTVFFEES